MKHLVITLSFVGLMIIALTSKSIPIVVVTDMDYTYILDDSSKVTKNTGSSTSDLSDARQYCKPKHISECTPEEIAKCVSRHECEKQCKSKKGTRHGSANCTKSTTGSKAYRKGCCK